MKGIISWFAHNSVAANLLMLVIILLGCWTTAELIPLEVFPTMDTNNISISVEYRGATPKEVEEAVLIRIEEAIANIEGIDEITSVANEGGGSVNIAVEDGYQPRDLLDDIKNKVDSISTFPDDVENPSYEIAKFRREVISVAVSAAMPERELRQLGEIIRDDISSLDEVNEVDLVAVRPYEIAIEIDQHTLERYGFTLQEIAAAIRTHSVDLPAGSIQSSGGSILLRTSGQAYNGSDFADIPIISKLDGSRLVLADIAQITDGFDEEPLYSLFNGKPAVLIEIYRTGDQSALTVASAVRTYVEEKSEQLPPGIQLNCWRDRSRVVKLRLQTLINSAIQGGFLIFIILSLFLRFSIAIWVCVGIPISFLGALALMPIFGITINILSLFSFILVLGIVVDDAIITGENVYAHMRRGEDKLNAVIKGTQEVAVPVTFGLLTTVAAFMPLLFMEGRRGPIFAQVPMIVIPVLFFSWIESKLILPSHLSHIRLSRKPHGPMRYLFKMQRRVADGLEYLIARAYQPLLKRALGRRHLTFSLFTAAIIIIVSLVIAGYYRYSFFPRIQSETARATLEMPAGTSIEQTRAIIERMAESAYRLQEKYQEPDGSGSVVRNILVSIGWNGNGRPGLKGNPERGRVTMELSPPEERLQEIETRELVKEWRQDIGPIVGIKELSFRAEIGRGGDPIAIRLSGYDFDQLSEVAELLKQRYREYPGLYDIQDSFDRGERELQLTLKPGADLLGVTTATLGSQVRSAFFGVEAQRVQRGRDDVRVMVRYPQTQRNNLASLENMKIRTTGNIDIPLEQVADVHLTTGFSSIYRIDRQRAVSVSADAEKAQVDLNAIAADLVVYLDELLLDYPGVRYSLGGELKEQSESIGSLIYGIIFVLFAIYALLAIPFRSYLQPFMVMLVIPYSIGGAIVGHMIMGLNLSFMSLLGILALCGVVVNDSLVLVDFINRRRREGMTLDEAVLTAGAARFRPILLTSLTTFFGLLPLMLETSTQAQFLIPMAVSLGFGILFGTFLSLLLVPASYMILEDFLGLFRHSNDTESVDES